MGGRRETSNSEKTGSEASGGEKEDEGGETRVKAEGEGAGGRAGEGLERVSATTFSGPGTWTTELANSAWQEMALLAGGPRRRHSKQSMSERFVVIKNCILSTF